MNEGKIKALFSDEAFVKHLFEQETAEQVQELLAEKEIVKLQELLEKHMNGELNLEELSEEDLEDVSGGSTLAFGLFLFVGLPLFVAACTVTSSALVTDMGMRAKRRRW